MYSLSEEYIYIQNREYRNIIIITLYTRIILDHKGYSNIQFQKPEKYLKYLIFELNPNTYFIFHILLLWLRRVHAHA